MDESDGARRELSGNELSGHYLVTALLAIVAAIASGLGAMAIASQAHAGCTRQSDGSWACPDGIGYAIPCLVVGFAAAAIVIVVMAFRIGRRARPETVRRMSLHALWLVFLVMLAPGLGWLLLMLVGKGSLYGLIGLVPAGLAVSPLITAYRSPSSLPLVLACCLLVPCAVLIAWQQLYLLLPVAVPVAGGWGIALWLALWARRLDGRVVRGASTDRGPERQD